MKISNFKIRDRLMHKNKLNPLSPENQDFQEKESLYPNSEPKFDIFMEKFQQFMNVHLIKNSSNNQKQETKCNKHNLQTDYRDRFVQINLPEFKNNKIQFSALQTWIGELSKEVLSVAFHYYSTGKFTYEQSKVYASESFLRNICRLANNYDISNEELKFIDKKMKNEIFPYLKTKYPMTNQKDSNKSLQKAIKEINNIEVLSNDFFYYTDLQFQFRENGRYDDLIMKLINQIMNKVNSKPPNSNDKSSLTNYKDFESFLTNIFQKTYDESWMNTKSIQEKQTEELVEKILQKESKTKMSQKIIKRKQSLVPGQNLFKDYEAQLKDEGEKQKYKLQVQQYTNFQIGRKISQNTQLFSQDEIKSKFLTIKSPAILRILTKWCDQLWQKFSNENYFLDSTEGIRMQKGNQINVVYQWLKVKLKNQMKAQKQNIQKFMKEIQQINYSQQTLLLKNELKSQSALHIDKIQRVTGKFSCKIVKNLQNFIIIYLNRLIHGLTTVSKNCFKQLSGRPSWPYPPNLISFKIGDLMRCKFSSKQREVLKVFQQIQRINDQEPQKMKIIRIKNRLKLGTNDVLLNVKFNNLITCQIQLAVSSTKTQFINCSYNFSHYVYELQRSFFGPITELCSIWKNLQIRSKQFSKLIQRQTSQKNTEIMKTSMCTTFNRSHILVENNLPFICYQCGKAYSQNNYMISHVKCSKCVYCKCAVCQIIENKQLKNKKFFLADETLNLNSSFSDLKEIPQFGVCIFIKRKPLQPIIFTRINYREKNYLFKKNDQYNRIQLMRQIGTTDEAKKFMNQCVLFSIPSTLCKNYINIDVNLAKRQFIIPSYIEECFKKQKETISILAEQLKTLKLDVIQKATKDQKKCIKYIQFSDTSLDNMDLISQDFINLDCINLNLNKIQNIQKIVKFPKLQKLYVIQNVIKQIPADIKLLTRLKQINLYKNQIQKLPQTIIELKSLISIKISNNLLQSLPQKFYQLQSLKVLIANNNKFKEFPISVTKHKRLQSINFENNKLETIPQQIQELENLKQLILSMNSLKKLPAKMNKMKKLQTVNLASNKFQQFSQSITFWTGLVQINIASNMIKNLTFKLQMQQLKNFVTINLESNGIQSINDSFQNLKSIEVIKLSRNKILNLNQQLSYLEQLRQIQLIGNKIQSLSPKSFSKCKKLKKIKISGNQILQLPDQFQNLKNLDQFSVFGNKLSQFPKSFLEITHLKVVTLNKFNIQVIPENIGKMKSLKQLNLAQNIIQIIPDSIEECQQLTILNLFSNKIKDLNICIFKLVNLEQINISSNNIEQLPDKFESLKKLKKLYVNQNKIKELPLSISNLQKLDFKFNSNLFQTLPSKLIKISTSNQVNLQDHKLKQIIGNEFQEKEKVTTFKLKKNLFENIPQFLFICPNVKSIDISENLLKELPKQIKIWKNLTTLNIQGNQIQILPQQIGELLQLNTLNIKCQALKFIPKSIQKLSLKSISLWGDRLDQIENLSFIHADEVDFSYQKLKQLSQNLGNLINVKSIKFQGNVLQKLPQSIGNLVQLTQLIIIKQKLQGLPQSIGNLINLKRLDLYQNSISQVPNSLGNLINLQKLQLWQNKLKQLPSSMSNLTNLYYIIVRHNMFEEVPPCFLKLNKITNLSIRVNKIKQIPIQLFTQVMQELYMQDNLIKKIPKQMERMKNLKTGKLFLTGNPVEQIEAYDYVIQKGEPGTINWAKQWKNKKEKQKQKEQKQKEQRQKEQKQKEKQKKQTPNQGVQNKQEPTIS